MASEANTAGKGTGRGLGKGLDALIRDTGNAATPPSVQTLSLSDVIPNPSQPRRSFSDEALDELAASIRSQGVLQPLLVRPSETPGKYEIVAGERRWRASRLAGLTEVPVLVRPFSDMETLAAALIENLQREDLSPVEESLGLQTLKEEFGLSQEELARRLGKSRSAIANSLRLLSLPEHIRADVSAGNLSAGHARALLSITDAEAQEELRARILEQGLSVREAEGLSAVWKETNAFFVAVPKPAAVTPEQGMPETAEEDTAPPAGGAAEADFSGSQTPPAEQADGDVFAEDAAEPTATISSQSIPHTAAKKNKPQSARLMEIQSQITSVLRVPVKVTGKESRGKISLTYNSREELDAILSRMALLAGETAAPAATSASEAVPDEDAAFAELDDSLFNDGTPSTDNAISEAGAVGEALPRELTPAVYMHLAALRAEQTHITTPEAVSAAVSIAEHLLASPADGQNTAEGSNGMPDE